MSGCSYCLHLHLSFLTYVLHQIKPLCDKKTTFSIPNVPSPTFANYYRPFPSFPVRSLLSHLKWPHYPIFDASHFYQFAIFVGVFFFFQSDFHTLPVSLIQLLNFSDLFNLNLEQKQVHKKRVSKSGHFFHIKIYEMCIFKYKATRILMFIITPFSLCVNKFSFNYLI